jgi:Tfp pilus assembly pilus retraction ATPase PilT
VLSTLHTNSAAQTIDRIISAFPEAAHRQMRQQLSQVLAGVVSLLLVERLDGEGLVAAVEIMRGSPRVQKLILDGNLQELHEEIERSVSYERMQSMNQSLAALVLNGAISRDQAVANASNPADLDLLLRKMCTPQEQGQLAGEVDMGVSKADFSNILRLQEIQKAYDELEERYQRDLSARDGQIAQLTEALQSREQAGSGVQEQIRALSAEKDKMARQIAFQKQEYEAKIEKLQNRIRELSASASEANRSGIFRR